MRITIQQIAPNHRKIITIHCCDELKDTMSKEKGLIGYGEIKDFPDENFSQNINIYQYIDEDMLEYYPINYCPFCGNAIIIKHE